jgi:DNA-binding transcriptional regulator LsrR (DeoR family)
LTIGDFERTDVMMPSPRDPDLLVRAARLYYQQRLSQDEVARTLGTSRSNISRMLTAAQEQGIVEIRINDPAGRDPELERALVQQFGLADAVVALRPSDPSIRPLDRVGALAWTWLRQELRDGMTIALSWGRTLQSMVWSITDESPLSIDVVQLVGGLSSVASEITGQELVREMATRLGARYRYLHAPAIFQTTAARDTMLNERSVSDALDAARRADVAVVGIGAVNAGSSSAILRAFGLTEAERSQFEAAQPVGDVVARFFDIEGREVHGPVHDRVLAVTLDDIRDMPIVVGLAVGREKVDGVVGALRGGFVDVLVTDVAAARGVLSVGQSRRGRRPVTAGTEKPTDSTETSIVGTETPPNSAETTTGGTDTSEPNVGEPRPTVIEIPAAVSAVARRDIS